MVGSILTTFLGWDKTIEVLLFAMVIDYMTGVLAAYINPNMALNSTKGFRGICKKIIILLLVALAHGLIGPFPSIVVTQYLLFTVDRFFLPPTASADCPVICNTCQNHLGIAFFITPWRELMFEHIIEALLIVALTSFGGYLFGTYRATHGAFVTMQHGLQALLRSSMLDAYDKFTRLGGCTVTDKQNFDNMYQCYHSLGINGVMSAIYDKVMAMPEIAEDGEGQ